ncbi:MAG: L-threonylcarbamoyladenylate synthase [Nitrosopumilus sp.]|nr:L-threonylcarbamoyladenylate synthase [Nitrosopumilus sp.]MDH3384770.1 L-threonylcarbamoyladenylate synthase [Nitrosopumilus sp.]
MKVKCDKEGIEKATKIIKDGGIVVFPTDTVYGIGCDPYKKKSVDKIYQIKGRSKTKPFPVLAYSFDEASKIVEFDKDSKKIANKFWPGPLTLILKLKDQRLKKSLNLENKIAIRVPNNQCLLNILENSKFLVGTSANISGENSFTKSNDCYQNIKDYDIFVDDGNIKTSGESTILEIDQGKPIIHRIGALKKEEIIEFF